MDLQFTIDTLNMLMTVGVWAVVGIPIVIVMMAPMWVPVVVGVKVVKKVLK